MELLNKKIIGIANDHAGYELKLKIVDYLQSKGYEIKNFGSDSTESVDYPDFAHILADALNAGECDTGISICCTGNGINMAVNKHNDIRGAMCWLPEISRLARAHNNANVCSLPAKFITTENAYAILDTFLNTSFEGGRHQRRIDKIAVSSRSVYNE